MRDSATPEEKLEALIERVMAGEPLRRVVPELFGSYQAFTNQVSSVRELQARYTQAMLLRADLMADEIISIADTEKDAQKARNMIDSRKWYAGKIQPARYGERLTMDIQQSISITEALDVARSRILRPVCDQLTIDAEVTESEPTISTLGPADSVSGADEPDIFS